MAKFELHKWQDALNSRRLRNDTNDNWQRLEDVIAALYQADEGVRNRIDNLILNSGGDSPLEVIDSHTDSLGHVHNTLQARLEFEFNRIKDEYSDVNDQMAAFATVAAELTEQLNKLYRADNDLILYVDGNKGNDITGNGTEENPFKTINKAVSRIPRLINANVIIRCKPAVYDEDVSIQQVYASNILLENANLDKIDPSKEDTGVFIRSISFIDCPGYINVSGFTQYDMINSGTRYTGAGVDEPVTFFFDRCGYGAINKCRFTENMKATKSHSVYYAASNGRVLDCYFKDQFECLYTNFNAVITFDETNKGYGNERLAQVGRSIVFAPLKNRSVTSDGGPFVKYAGGQVFE
ncbi:hypothetical protein [Bacillus cereus]|uniref:hypothetical protein n=1 Tax=Bacillus cereus TaxID=1396 RepID=UPI002362EE64|nr:hypothetical protein [Bacillus cereus]MDD0822654.1 hypothetical protein [Bacillus cereus]